MASIVSHFWIRGIHGGLTLCEVDYSIYPIREGVLCYAKVPGSERICTCLAQGFHERRLAGALN